MDTVRPGPTEWHAVRFSEKIEKLTSGCWVWRRRCNAGGYGLFEQRGKEWLAHRVAWEIANSRAVPDNLCVLHACDNPPCVRPSHLTLGTRGDNNRQAVARGRRDHIRYLTGAAHQNTKLTAEQMDEIVRRYRENRIRNSQPKLAKEFGVTQATISRVVNGKERVS